MFDTRLSTRSSLADQIAPSLAGREPTWLPGLAPALLDAFETHSRKAGWSSRNYGTLRWIVGDPHAPRRTVSEIRLRRGSFSIELLPQDGLDVLSGLPMVHTVSADMVARVQAAADLIGVIDELAATISEVVCSAHMLAAARGYDVSHSTPELPLSIFVSVPDADERNAVARLAESIIHEAMHLQLTLIESLVPLISAPNITAFSPWQQSERPVRGVLHGLYVFAVISEALGAFASRTSEIAAYAAVRRAQIAEEVSQMSDGRDALTDVGVSFWERLTSQVLEAS
jgi:HEXXH motif-containing protein